MLLTKADNEARFVSVIKNLTRRTRTEYRSATGGDISFRSKYRPGLDGLKIVRDGSKFKTYTSTKEHLHAAITSR